MTAQRHLGNVCMFYDKYPQKMLRNHNWEDCVLLVVYLFFNIMLGYMYLQLKKKFIKKQMWTQ